MSSKLTLEEREKIIADYMLHYPQGISTSAISQATGLSKVDLLTAFNRLKSSGDISPNGLKGKNRWIYKPVERFPRVCSIFAFADYVARQMGVEQVSQ